MLTPFVGSGGAITNRVNVNAGEQHLLRVVRVHGNLLRGYPSVTAFR